MRLAIGSDHAGWDMKKELLVYLQGLGHEVEDVGNLTQDPLDDYPDFAEAVALAVHQRRAERGVLICGSGVGASIAANKIPGVRAALCHDTYSAHQGVEHDQMNVLVLGSRVIGSALAQDLVAAYLHAEFTGEARHVRRLSKISAIEARYHS